MNKDREETDIENKILQNNENHEAADDDHLSDSLSDDSEEHQSIRVSYADNSFKYRYKLFRFLGLFLIILMMGIGIVQMVNLKKVQKIDTAKQNEKYHLKNHIEIKKPTEDKENHEQTNIQVPNKENPTQISKQSVKDTEKETQVKQNKKPEQIKKPEEIKIPPQLLQLQKLVVQYGDEFVVTDYPKSEVFTLTTDQPLQKPRELLDLSDMTTINEHLNKMQKGKLNKQEILDRTDRKSFGYELYSRPNSQMNLKAEFVYYDKVYSIGKYSKELPLCIVSAGRNMLDNNLYRQFFDSIERQNYTNYKLILIDDQSSDQTFPTFKKVLSELKMLKNRFILIRNPQNIGSLGNKDFMIRNHCKSGDIVLDIDADDSIVGRQVFNVINALYQGSDNWFVYSTYLFKRTNRQRVQVGRCADILKEDFKQNSYRTSKSWVTSELRSYYRDLFVKIPREYFFKNETHYNLWAADRYVMYAVTELAGQNHTKFIPDVLYWYNINRARPQCFLLKAQLDEYKARKQTPLLPLKSLNQKVEVTKEYKIPRNITQKYDELSRKYSKCPQNPKLL